MASNTELFRKEFRAWLDANANRIVGVGRTSDRCPIATYLVSRTGQHWVVSRRECVEQSQRARRGDFHTPRWARDFIKVIDKQVMGHNVTGAEALYLLDEAVK